MLIGWEWTRPAAWQTLIYLFNLFTCCWYSQRFSPRGGQSVKQWPFQRAGSRKVDPTYTYHAIFQTMSICICSCSSGIRDRHPWHRELSVKVIEHIHALYFTLPLFEKRSQELALLSRPVVRTEHILHFIHLVPRRHEEHDLRVTPAATGVAGGVAGGQPRHALQHKNELHRQCLAAPSRVVQEQTAAEGEPHRHLGCRVLVWLNPCHRARPELPGLDSPCGQLLFQLSDLVGRVPSLVVPIDRVL